MFQTRLQVNNHQRDECIEATTVTEIRASNVYKWDSQHEFLRTYPLDTVIINGKPNRLPFLMGWLDNTTATVTQQTRDIIAEIGAVQDPTIKAEGVRVWNGDNDTELVDRSDQKQRILDLSLIHI